MQGVVEGFATIGVVIGLGMLLAQLGVLALAAHRMLSRLSFFVASPALMVTVLMAGSSSGCLLGWLGWVGQFFSAGGRPGRSLRTYVRSNTLS